MISRIQLRRLVPLVLAGFAAILPIAPAQGQLADLADVPLAQAPSTAVRPNLMYILDDSGSMDYTYMPDQVHRTSRGDIFLNCKRCKTEDLGVNAVSTSSERFTSSANHGGAVNALVVFTVGPLPVTLPPLVIGTTYYMNTVPSATTFTLSTTPGGASINVTTAATGARFIVNGICAGPDGREAVNYNTSFANAPGAPCGNNNTDANIPLNDNDEPTFGEVPFYSADFNKIWYNPNVTYTPAPDSTGTNLPASVPTAAKQNAFLAASPTDNLVTSFKEVIYCSTNNPTALDLVNPLICRYNGKHNVGPFLLGQPTYFQYFGSTGTNVGLPTLPYRYKKLVATSNPHYYRIITHEYCSDLNLTNCTLAPATGDPPAAPLGFPLAAPVRWCKTVADAADPLAISGTSGTPATPRCREKFDRLTHPYPRYGRFVRVDIVPATASYPKGPSAVRVDCAAATTCTYAEELQNFANWYSYYRVRLALMKTATGRAFLTIDDRYRVGFITINPNNPVSASKYVALNTFTSAQRLSFYTRLYAQTTNGGTPLRQALSRVGRYYAGITGDINSGMGADPVQYSCQTNHALLTTDGYWNGAEGINLGGGGVGNQDGSDSGYTTRAVVGAYDGGLSGGDVQNSLADVAAYYYATDLRTAGPTAPNNVPSNGTGGDTAVHQHMVTFTLGLGLDGFMDYTPTYDVDPPPAPPPPPAIAPPLSDFLKIKRGLAANATDCPWTTGTCNWPIPAANEPSTLDDLWHAAVNGRGRYFSASDPNSLALGLQSALASLNVRTAAASASATSSPNITQTDNFIFSSTFRTGFWDGEVVARRIDLLTGNLLPTIEWAAQALLDARSTTNSDTRTIYTIDEAGGNKRKNFLFANLSAGPIGAIAAERNYFTNKCPAFGQCALLTTTQQAIANDGTNLVNYLRGHREFESFGATETQPPFRPRAHLLGDSVNSAPVFVRRPLLGYTDAVVPSYDDFKIAQAGRTGMLYFGANDGMLHALDGTTGQEVWAYVPRIVMPNIHALGNVNWGSAHRFNVDGSPQTQDVYIGGQWKTILVAGLNKGGRGYYAIDVTVPNSPKVLWEICSDATLCQIVEPNMGYSYGNPLITKRASDGKWVVFLTSGHNNVSPGDGRGWLYTVDIATGTVLNRVSTNEGTVASPSGLSKIAGYADNPFTNNTAKFIYGGDLYGNVWKFNTATAIPTVTKLATLRDATNKPQSVTTRPELAELEGFPVVYIGTGRYLGTQDLVDPATLIPPLNIAYNNTIYGIKDRGVTYINFRTNPAVVQNSLIDAGTSRTVTTNPVDWVANDGFFVDLNPGNTSPGERVNVDPQLFLGVLAVIGNIPNNSVCTVGGDAFVYFLDYKSGSFPPAGSATPPPVGQKITGQTLVGLTVVGRDPSANPYGPGGPPPTPPGCPNPSNPACDPPPDLYCYVDGATGERIRVDCPKPGGGGKARRISWRELIQQ